MDKEAGSAEAEEGTSADGGDGEADSTPTGMLGARVLAGALNAPPGGDDEIGVNTTPAGGESEREGHGVMGGGGGDDDDDDDEDNAGKE